MRKSFVNLIALLLVSALALGLIVSPAKAQEPINLQEAISVAQALYPSAKVLRTELTRLPDGTPIYIIGLDNGRSVYLNALTREIIQILNAQAPPSVAGMTTPLRPVVPPAPVIPPSGTGASITYERAVQIALAQYPGAQVIGAELTRKGGRFSGALAWDIKLNNGLAVYVSATNGAILEIEPIRGGPPPREPRGRGPRGPRGGPPLVNYSEATISYERALQIALSVYPNAQVIGAELTRKGGPFGGALAWDVKLNNGFAVYVSATDGSILEIEPLRR